MTHDTLTDLIESRGGAEFTDERPYVVKFPDGTERYVVGKSPKDAAAKVCEARLVEKREIKEAAFALIGVLLNRGEK